MGNFVDGAVIIGGSILVAIIGVLLVRKKFSEDALRANHEVAGYMLSIVGTLYAILLGLIVVNVQTKFEVANQMAVTEANCLSDLGHISTIFNDTNHKAIVQHLYDYSIAARDQDWAKVAAGTAKEATIPSYRALWKSITQIELTNSKQESAYSNLLSAMSQLSDARRYRMVAGHNGLSPILWVVLILGELVIVWFTYFFFVKSMQVQFTLTVFVVVFLSLNIYLVYLYDNPYRSELGARNAGVTFHPEWFEPSKQTLKSGEAHEN